MAKILIAGCGYVGCVLGAQLAAQGHRVWGMRRRPLARITGLIPIEADLAIPSSLQGLPPDLDIVFYLVSPSGADDAFYRAAYVDGLRTLLEALEKQGQRPSRVLFVSSTAVYVQQGGEWVDETSPTEPTHFSGQRLLEGEQVLFGGPFSGVVVRFGGIYGPRRIQIIDRARSGRAEYAPGPPRYTNRIHRDDCAGVLRHLMNLSDPARVYLGVDSEPAQEFTVLRWVSAALGAQPPRPVRAEKIASQPGRGNKRCRNNRLLESGYEFRYPTFREGYRDLIAGIY